MKILQLVYESLGNPFGFGGAGVRSYEIYKRLNDKHDITLLCMKYPGSEDGEIEGLQHKFVGTASRSLSKSVFAYTINAANYVRKYGNDFDIIIENFLPATPFFSRFLTKTPVILQVQGIMEKHVFKKFSQSYAIPMYLVENFYPRLYDKFMFVSDITKGKVIDRIKCNQLTCHVIPNGVDQKLFDILPGEDDYILFFSRLDSYTKGLDILVKAFEHISEQYPYIELVLAGYEITRFKKLVKDCSPAIKDRIRYVGFLTGDEKVKLLSDAKIFVLPSRHESSPISILEAAACEKPIIVSNIPELSFVENKQIGLTFESGNFNSLAERITTLLDDDVMRKNIGGQARKNVKEFLWDKTALMFEDILKKYVQKSK